jgi:diphthine synthase
MAGPTVGPVLTVSLPGRRRPPAGRHLDDETAGQPALPPVEGTLLERCHVPPVVDDGRRGARQSKGRCSNVATSHGETEAGRSLDYLQSGSPSFLNRTPNPGPVLTFVGLGLYDERSVTVEGQEAIRAADRVVGEFYTSRLVGATVADVEEAHGVDVEVRDRASVERDPGDLLDDAESRDVVFLTAGDPMTSTTHVDLRLRARERGIDTRVVHGVTAATAAAGLTGLQNYRFGKATTLPFPDAHGGDGVPDSVLATLDENRERGLHTLVYLDIKVDAGQYGRPGADGADDDTATGAPEAFMTGDRAAELLADDGEDVLAVVVARAGSPDPLVAADRLSALADRDFGDPLHLLVVPGDLHHVEAEALAAFGDAPVELLPD